VYSGHVCSGDHVHSHAAPVGKDPGDLDALVNDLINKVYDQRVQAGDVHADTWRYTTEQYWKAVQTGWDETPKYFTKAQLILLELRRNVNTFAAFKNHANVIELTQSLIGEDGKPISFSKFKKLALDISSKYNTNWLQAEYNFAQAAAQSAAIWEKLSAKGGKLEYKTVGDGRVRDEHKKLDGTLLPMTHPFWKLYYPPNGWNCRCFVRWRPDTTEDVAPKELPDVIEMFRNNVGTTSQIFTDAHPFIREIGAAQADKIKKLADYETMRWERTYIKELAKQNLVGKTVMVEQEGFKGTISFTGRSINEATNQPHENILAKNRALLDMLAQCHQQRASQ
jgi:SPP1 gp7 family putative phage head morphogenesis protein